MNSNKLLKIRKILNKVIAREPKYASIQYKITAEELKEIYYLSGGKNELQ